MKIRMFILAAVITASSLGASARGLGLFDFGVKAGVSTQKVHLYNPGKSGTYGLSVDNKPAFQFGALARINFLTFHIQPEILYTFNRYELTADYIGSGRLESHSAKVKYNNLEVPVLFGMKLLMLRIQAGPVFNVSNSTSVAGHKNSDAFSVEASRPSVSWAVGLGLDLFRFNFDVRYNGKFSRGDQTISLGSGQGFDYKTRTRGWTFSLAYLF